jgi:hypothetical protein
MRNLSQEQASESVIPRSAVATPDQVAELLALTPERIEELQKEQALKLYRSRAILTANERRIGRGIELEKHYLITGNRNGLAEALMLQGKYDAAADAAEDPEIKASYLEMHDAVHRDDKLCGCDLYRQENGCELPNHYVAKRGHSFKHRAEIAFVRCTQCGELNALTTPQHLAEQQALRNSPTASDKERLSFFKI